MTSNTFWAVVILAAIVGSFWFNHETASRTAHSQWQSLVIGCQRSDVQKALGANGWLLAAEARRAEGNKAKAAQYDAIATGMIGTIPPPADVAPTDSRLAQVTFESVPEPHYVVSKQALALQKAGCVRAYPEP